ncbi:hypothetical protein DO72_2210 [Burkholderia pseudomallei]|nr:hypothetical protein DO72_2210 [Burkholderia pseudomallei]
MSRCAVQPGLSTQLDSSAGAAGASALGAAGGVEAAEAGAAAFCAPGPGAFAHPAAATAKKAAAIAPARERKGRGRIRSVMNTSVRTKERRRAAPAAGCERPCGGARAGYCRRVPSGLSSDNKPLEAWERTAAGCGFGVVKGAGGKGGER